MKQIKQKTSRGRALASLFLAFLWLLTGLCACSASSGRENTAIATLPDGLVPGGTIPAATTKASPTTSASASSATQTRAALTTAAPLTTEAGTTPQATSGTYSWQTDPGSIEDLEGVLEGFDYSPYLPVPENVSRTDASLDYLYAHRGINHVGGGQKVVSLTFSIGTESGYTSQLLDVLKEKEVPATFLLSLKEYLMSAKDDPAELVRRMAREGHAIGSHGYTHVHSTMATNRRFLNELLLFQAELDQVLRYHYPVTLFGAPYETLIERDIYLCDLMDIHFLGYSFLLADDNGQAPVYMVLPLLKNGLASGSIMQMHVSEGNVEAIGQFIDYAKEQGYRFVLPEG